MKGPIEIQRAGDSLPRFEGSGDSTVTCPFDFAIVPGAEAELALGALREALPSMTPLIFGNLKRAASLIRTVKVTIEPIDILRLADSLDLEGWFAKRLDYLRRRDRWPPRHGGWPAKTMPTTDLGTIREVSGAIPTHVVIGLLPCAEYTAAAAYLRFGGWDDCPLPQVHVALARVWARSHGAVLVASMSSTLEFRVQRPITTREHAMEMAMTHYLYNFETVNQPGTIELAASSLLSSSVWQFWWD